MKHLIIRLLALCTGILFGPLSAHAQNSMYWNYTPDTDYSGLGPNGGTIVVPMLLQAGDPVPGIGTQINLTLTISEIRSYYAPQGTYTWNNTPPGGAVYPGPIYPNNVYTDLPDQNVTSLPTTINGISIADDYYGWWYEALNEGLIVYLGEFDITVSAYPPPPEGYQMNLALTVIGWDGGGNLHINEADEAVKGYLSFFDTIYSDFDVTLTARFSAFTLEDFSEPTSQFWFLLPTVTYELIPEPSAPILLLGGAAAARLLHRRKTKTTPAA